MLEETFERNEGKRKA